MDLSQIFKSAVLGVVVSLILCLLSPSFAGFTLGLYESTSGLGDRQRGLRVALFFIVVGGISWFILSALKSFFQD